MDNEFDRYYIKIRTILGNDANLIHEEPTTGLEPNAPSYVQSPPGGQAASMKKEKMSTMILNLVVQYPSLTDENIELIRHTINNDPHSTYDEIIAETSRSLIVQ